MCESLNFHFYTPPSAHNWNSYFGKLGGTDSNDNNSLDFHWKNTKFFFKFMIQMCTLKNIQATSKNSLPFKSYCRNGVRRSHVITFSKRLRLVNKLPLTFFLPKIWFQDYWSLDIGKTFPSQIRLQIVRLPFYAPSSPHNWNQYFW